MATLAECHLETEREWPLSTKKVYPSNKKGPILEEFGEI